MMRALMQDQAYQELHDSGKLGRNQACYLLHRALLWREMSLHEEVEMLCEEAEDSMVETLMEDIEEMEKY